MGPTKTFNFDGKEYVADCPALHIWYTIVQHKLPRPVVVPLLHSNVLWLYGECIALNLPEPHTHAGYACCLHELGHVLHPEGHLLTTMGVVPTDSIYWDTIIKSEEAAWEWAQREALVWTPKMEEFKTFCLTTYYNKRKLSQQWREQ